MVLTELERQQSSIFLTYLAEQEEDGRQAAKLYDLGQREELDGQELLNVIMAAAIFRADSRDILLEQRKRQAAADLMARMLSKSMGEAVYVDRVNDLLAPEEPAVAAVIAANNLLRLLNGEPPAQVLGLSLGAERD